MDFALASRAVRAHSMRHLLRVGRRCGPPQRPVMAAPPVLARRRASSAPARPLSARAHAPPLLDLSAARFDARRSGRQSRRDAFETARTASGTHSTTRSLSMSGQSPRTPTGALVVYTDGSCHGNYASGVGIYLGEDHPLNLSQALHGPRHSSGLAEIKAAQIALERLRAWSGYTGEHVCLRTDYKPMIDTLSNGRHTTYGKEIAEVRRLAASFPKGVTFQHIYGHNGHREQEKADELARLSTMGSRRARSASPYCPTNFEARRGRSRSRSRSRSRQRSASRVGRKGAGAQCFVGPQDAPFSARSTTARPPPTSAQPRRGLHTSATSVHMSEWPFQSNAETSRRGREVVIRPDYTSSRYANRNSSAGSSMATVRTLSNDINTGSGFSTGYSRSGSADSGYITNRRYSRSSVTRRSSGTGRSGTRSGQMPCSNSNMYSSSGSTQTGSGRSSLQTSSAFHPSSSEQTYAGSSESVQSGSSQLSASTGSAQADAPLPQQQQQRPVRGRSRLTSQLSSANLTAATHGRARRQRYFERQKARQARKSANRFHTSSQPPAHRPEGGSRHSSACRGTSRTSSGHRGGYAHAISGRGGGGRGGGGHGAGGHGGGGHGGGGHGGRG